ncbi:hypothetical protein [Thalassotalea sp. PLHSN55]|uniref:hypothetical protein n=1 Tax=Thalassotalea sp. PLHSN55 TaxID=3435888 RepID=UPI003F87C84C
MKFITIIFTLLFSFSAMAHDDHYLGDGMLHNIVHACLFCLAAIACYKVGQYIRQRFFNKAQ